MRCMVLSYIITCATSVYRTGLNHGNGVVNRCIKDRMIDNKALVTCSTLLIHNYDPKKWLVTCMMMVRQSKIGKYSTSKVTREAGMVVNFYHIWEENWTN